MAYMTCFSMSINFFTIWRTPSNEFDTILQAPEEEDDDPKGISSDNESNLDS